MSETEKAVIALPSITDIATVGDLKEQLSSALAGGQSIAIDATNVERIDAASMQLLAACFRFAETQGVSCVWESASDAVLDAARLCGLEQILDLAQAA